MTQEIETDFNTIADDSNNTIAYGSNNTIADDSNNIVINDDIIKSLPEINKTDINTVSEIIHYCLSSEEYKSKYKLSIAKTSKEFIDSLPEETQKETYKKYNEIISSDVKECKHTHNTIKYLNTFIKSFKKLIDYQLESKLLHYKIIDNTKHTWHYKGQINNSQLCGNGLSIYYISDIKIFSYEGVFENNKFNGIGIITFEKW